MSPFQIWLIAFVAMSGVTALMWRFTKSGEDLPVAPLISRYSGWVPYVPRWLFAGGYHSAMFVVAFWANGVASSGRRPITANALAAVFFVGLYAANLALALTVGRGMRLEKRPPPANLSGD